MLTGTPLDLTPFGGLLAALGWLYWAIAAGLIVLALWLPKAGWMKLAAGALVTGSDFAFGGAGGFNQWIARVDTPAVYVPDIATSRKFSWATGANNLNETRPGHTSYVADVNKQHRLRRSLRLRGSKGASQSWLGPAASGQIRI